jgi:transposase
MTSTFRRSAVRQLSRRDDGGPSLPPGIYFRLLVIGYFEGIDSERGIAWRAADSLALRDFLALGPTEPPPDTRRFPGLGDSLRLKRIERCSHG